MVAKYFKAVALSLIFHSVSAHDVESTPTVFMGEMSGAFPALGGLFDGPRARQGKGGHPACRTLPDQPKGYRCVGTLADETFHLATGGWKAAHLVTSAAANFVSGHDMWYSEAKSMSDATWKEEGKIIFAGGLANVSYEGLGRLNAHSASVSTGGMVGYAKGEGILSGKVGTISYSELHDKGTNLFHTYFVVVFPAGSHALPKPPAEPVPNPHTQEDLKAAAKTRASAGGAGAAAVAPLASSMFGKPSSDKPSTKESKSHKKKMKEEVVALENSLMGKPSSSPTKAPKASKKNKTDDAAAWASPVSMNTSRGEESVPLEAALSTKGGSPYDAPKVEKPSKHSHKKKVRYGYAPNAVTSLESSLSTKAPATTSKPAKKPSKDAKETKPHTKK
mmetsp:Transcript_11992/g.17879  ORF Transcript_11992/g.17879 Transcript_11992/m.17879 type:complete len:391 (+) Transcript_11992:138-1310(+)